MATIPSISLSTSAGLGLLQTNVANNAVSDGTAIDLSVLTLLKGGGNGASPLPATVLYKYYDKNGADLLQKSNDSKQVKTAVEYFTTQIKKVTSVDQVFKDPKLYSFVTTAVGLGATADTQRGLIKRALTGYVIPPSQVQQLKTNGLLNANGRPVDSAAQAKLVAEGFLDPANPTRVGVANQLSDPTYANAAATLNFANTGLKTIKSQSVINQLVRQFQSVTFENSINTKSATVAEARYALAKLPGLAVSASAKASDGNPPPITNPADVANGATAFGSSAVAKANYGLLSDATLRDFVSTAFNIPKQVVNQSIQSQANLFGRKVDVTQLNNPTYVNKLISTYLAQSDSNFSNAKVSSGQVALNLFGR